MTTAVSRRFRRHKGERALRLWGLAGVVGLAGWIAALF